MKTETKITVGKATKYKKVRMDVAKIIAMYKDGKLISEIAVACGYPPNTGQNRTRRIIEKAGLYKRPAKKAAKKSAAKKAAKK